MCPGYPFAFSKWQWTIEGRLSKRRGTVAYSNDRPVSYIRESPPYIVSLSYHFSRLPVSLTYITQAGLQSHSSNPNNVLHF